MVSNNYSFNKPESFFLCKIFDNLNLKSNLPACKIEGITITYHQLNTYVSYYYHLINSSSSPIIGVVPRNDFKTYAALLAIWFNGKGYLPLPDSYPKDRLDFMISSSNVKIIIDPFDYIESVEKSFNFDFSTFDKSRIAYLLFTSGSTGSPKGVPISFNNVSMFCDSFQSLNYKISSEDRFLQMFDLTFDLSVMSWVVPLIFGSSFYTVSAKITKGLSLYNTLIKDRITFALMVPSVTSLLKPYEEEIYFSDLKNIQFCGEALRIIDVEFWSRVTNNARIDNVYGPTEATIYCSSYTIPQTGLIVAKGDWVSIGKPMVNVKFEISDSNVVGELIISGGQVSNGYLVASEIQFKSFFHGKNGNSYNTGDIVSVDLESGNFLFHGRKDEQVKIKGYRVELNEIEYHIKRILPDLRVVAFDYINKEISELGICIETYGSDLENELLSLKRRLKDIMPEYMIPDLIFTLDSLPYNANGKIDKNQLRELAKRKLI